MQEFHYSDAGVALTRQFEGLRLTAYQDSRGVWTIGYGHTGPDVHAGLTITEPEAQALLRRDLAASEQCVNAAVTGAIAQHHFDALVDFTFNLGCTSLRQSSLLRLVNAGDLEAAAREFAKWVNVNGKPLAGLVRRRTAEAAMFASTQPKQIL
jgi:lysozyme